MTYYDNQKYAAKNKDISIGNIQKTLQKNYWQHSKKRYKNILSNIQKNVAKILLGISNIGRTLQNIISNSQRTLQKTKDNSRKTFLSIYTLPYLSTLRKHRNPQSMQKCC